MNLLPSDIVTAGLALVGLWTICRAVVRTVLSDVRDGAATEQENVR